LHPLILILLFVAACFLAYSNGANDNFKGVATLFGSGTANLTTGLLVTTASLHGLPVSTTHVSVGSIFGIGTYTKKANVKVIRNILLSWVLTLPIAAIVSGIIYAFLS
jgi:PiT family inorganic phosphate transporter